MPTPLLDKQFKFAELIAKLILIAIQKGYQVTVGEAWRPPEMAALYAEERKGISSSLHLDRVAMDLNLFIKREYLKDTKDYEEIGLIWESFSSEDYQCVWGGRFKTIPDGNHFSVSFRGAK